MKMEAGFGIERMHGMRDAENNHRDCGIARKFGSGCRGWGSRLGTFS